MPEKCTHFITQKFLIFVYEKQFVLISVYLHTHSSKLYFIFTRNNATVKTSHKM